MELTAAVEHTRGRLEAEAKARAALEKDLASRGEELKVRLAEVAGLVLAFSDKGNPKLVREYLDELDQARRIHSARRPAGRRGAPQREVGGQKHLAAQLAGTG